MSTTIAATKHTCEPEDRAFGKRAPGCARCAELAAGAPARGGWQKNYFARKAVRDAAPVRPHSCATSGCNTVCCTFGDW